MPGPIDYTKLRILPDFDTADWWAGTRQRKYLVRQCNACGHKWFPPIFPACAKCASMDVGWFETAGKGTIYSYVVVVQPIVGQLGEVLRPYVIVVGVPDVNVVSKVKETEVPVRAERQHAHDDHEVPA